MPESILNRAQPGLSRMLFFSFLAHAIFAAGALIILIKTESKRTFIKPAYTLVELVERTEPAKEEPVPEPAKEKPLPVEKTVKRVSKEKTLKPLKPQADKRSAVKKEKVSVENAIERMEKNVKKKEEDEFLLKRVNEIEKRAQKKTSDEEVRNLIAALKKELALKENEASPVKASATASTDKSRSVKKELSLLKFHAYYNMVGGMIQSAWAYPSEKKEGLTAWLQLKITRNGELKAVLVEKTSGNTLFDESALRAVKKASPFPPVPEEMEGTFLEVGLRFCPGGCD